MNWFQRLANRIEMEKQLDAELRFHFESQVADKMRAGLTEAEARRAAAWSSAVSRRSSKSAAKAVERSGLCRSCRTCASARASWHGHRAFR